MSTPSAVARKRGPRRRAWWVAATVLAAGGAAAVLVATGTVAWPFAAAPADAAVASTVTVTGAPYQVSVAGPGTLQAARTLAVTNPTAGTIAKLAKVGQRVSQGDVLAQLDPTPLERALRDADLALRKAEAQRDALAASQSDAAAALAKQIADARAAIATQERSVERASQTLELQQRLLALGAVSASDEQSAQDALEVASSTLADGRRAMSTLQTSQELQRASSAHTLTNAELAVQQQQIAVEQAREDLDSITTLAPFDGVVSSVATEVGAYVPADGTVLTLIDDRTLDLPAQIDETEISKVKTGQSATVTLDAMSGQTFAGTVTAIAPTGEAVSNIPVFEVTVSLDNQALQLRPGMTAEAAIAVRSVANAFTLPLSALQPLPTPSQATAGASGSGTTATSGSLAASKQTSVSSQAAATPQAGSAAGTPGSSPSASATSNRRRVMVQQPDGSFTPRVVELVDSVGYNAVVSGGLQSGDVVQLAATEGSSSRASSSAQPMTGPGGGIPGLGGGAGMGRGGMP